MADVKRFSVGLIDVAERFADVVDAAEGRGNRKNGSGAKWLILPAAGAGAYALATSSSSFARQARRLIGRAKDRATDLPDADLLNRVKDATGTTAQSSPGSRSSSQSSSGSRRSSSQRRRRSASTGRRKARSG
jgi:hypothetical protein